MKLLKSIGLISGTMGVWVFAGIMICIFIWIILSGLFLSSRFTKRLEFFTEWSWPQFLMTIAVALGVPYIVLLLSAGF